MPISLQPHPRQAGAERFPQAFPHLSHSCFGFVPYNYGPFCSDVYLDAHVTVLREMEGTFVAVYSTAELFRRWQRGSLGATAGSVRRCDWRHLVLETALEAHPWSASLAASPTRTSDAATLAPKRVTRGRFPCRPPFPRNARKVAQPTARTCRIAQMQYLLLYYLRLKPSGQLRGISKNPSTSTSVDKERSGHQPVETPEVVLNGHGLDTVVARLVRVVPERSLPHDSVRAHRRLIGEASRQAEQDAPAVHQLVSVVPRASKEYGTRSSATSKAERLQHNTLMEVLRGDGQGGLRGPRARRAPPDLQAAPARRPLPT
jgi:hypothetical protein